MIKLLKLDINDFVDVFNNYVEALKDPIPYIFEMKDLSSDMEICEVDGDELKDMLFYNDRFSFGDRYYYFNYFGKYSPCEGHNYPALVSFNTSEEFINEMGLPTGVLDEISSWLIEEFAKNKPMSKHSWIGQMCCIWNRLK